MLEVADGPLTLPNGKKTSFGLLYNSSYIGPLITATLGEEISVDVANKATSVQGTSVHWHGMDLPNAAWADGVGGVTQRPIPRGETFRYKFKAQPAGTFWYHSHVGMQFADGLRGPLIVKDPKDPHKGLYDEEVVLLLTDQNAESGEAELKALQDGAASMSMGVCTEVSGQDWSDAPFTTLLTNGKGFMPDPLTKKPLGSPHVIKVQQGKRYRFRVIQGAASWGIKVKVAGQHTIDVIALDGSNVQPTRAKGFVFTPGERVDFILHANQPVGNYQIDIATLTGKNSPALLSYVGADEKAAPPPQLSLGCDWARYDPDILDFKNVTLKPHASVPAPPSKPDVTLAVYLVNGADPAQSQQAVLGASKGVLGLNATAKPQSGCSKLPDGRENKYCWQQNWIEFDEAKNGVPLLFPDMRPGAQTYIQEVPYGAVVDVVLINPGAMLHPMHLHGQRFWVLGTGNGQILTPAGKIDYAKLNSGRAIMRDTQPVANAVPAASAAAKPPMAAGATGAGMPAQHGRKLLQSMAGMETPAAAATPLAKPEAMASMPGMPAPATAAPKPDGMAGMAAKPAAMVPAAKPAPATAAPKPDGMAGMAAKPAAMAPAAKPAGMPGMAAAAMAAPKSDGMAGMPAAAPAMSEAAALTPGWAVIRFKADNPGVWAFHCHIDLHANSGMMMAFKVAAPKQDQGPWSLPKDVTTCGQAKTASPVKSVDGMQQASVKAPLPEDKPAPAPAPAPARSAAAGRVPAGSMLLQWSLAAALCMIAAMGLA